MTIDTAKLKAVLRHSVDGYGRQDISYNDPEGEFVFYSDYEAPKDALEAAEKRNAELEQALSACNRWADKCREAEKRVAELENDEVRQRLANAEHQLYMAELAKNNLRASRKAQFRKRKAAEKRISELEARTLRVHMPALRNAEMMSDLAWNSAIDHCFDALIKATDEAGINLETGGGEA
ncbi:hypothetical protein [Cronobacter malonaticus]|uniref:hypothetical protein n=1 Tax=Cronobacter malonaticus TaxID=413503 RepID=UPI001F4469F4|nr:hypothetical protein [Cronobacter malonaticus]